MRKIVFLMVTIVFAAVPVLAQQGGANAVGSKGMQVHGAPVKADPNEQQGLAGALKKAKLAGFPAKTVGAAFDDYRYFSKREWRETRTVGGKIYVDFTGWFKIGLLESIKGGLSSRGIGVKFLVNPDGNWGAVMVSRIEQKTDGMMNNQPIEDLNGILKKIYENKEIKF